MFCMVLRLFYEATTLNKQISFDKILSIRLEKPQRKVSIGYFSFFFSIKNKDFFFFWPGPSPPPPLYVRALSGGTFLRLPLDKYFFLSVQKIL